MIETIIIDDEALAVANLKTVIEQFVPEFTVIGTATSIVEGAKLWRSVHPQVVFLDVEMEGGTGFDVWDLGMETETIVVMVTAHREYALNALKRGAFDYLLKPVDIEEIETLSGKIQERLLRSDRPLGESGYQRLKLPVRDGFRLVDPSSVRLLKAEKSYTRFEFTNGEHLLVSRNIKAFEAELSSFNIVRCHKSYCINLREVTEYSRTDGGRLILTDGSSIPVSKDRKAQLLEKIG